MKSKKNKGKSKKKKKILIVAITCFALFIAIPVLIAIVATIIEINNENSAKQVRAAQLAADPISTSGLYTTLNKERAGVGASALATNQNLVIAANQFCNDMTTSKYFGYTNPNTGKKSSDFITENSGGQYYKNYVSSIMSALDGQQTASEIVQAAINNQGTNLNNPNFTSIGWSICQSPNNPAEKYIVAALAEIKERPVTNYYQKSTTSTAPAPSRLPVRAPPTTCNSYYNDLTNSVTTNCN